MTRSTAFAVSLRTSDPRQAARARPDAERRYYAKVDSLREELARQSNAAPLRKADAEALAIRWFLDALERADDFRTPERPDAIEQAVEDAEWGAAEARRALAEGDLANEKRLARCLREAAGFAEEPLAEAWLIRLLGRGAVALYEVEAGRVLARYETRPKDPLFASAMDAPAAPPVAVPTASAAARSETPERTLGDLVEAYKLDKWAKLSGSTRRSYAPVLRLLQGVISPETPLGDIDRTIGRKLFGVVETLPSGLGRVKALAGLPLLQAIAAGEKLGLPRITAKTANDSYLAHLRAVFDWGVREGWLGSNPLAGLSVHDAVRAEDRRDPLGDKLAEVFGGPPWNPADTRPRGGPMHYWGPLLGLFHGMRLGEIAALRCDDIGDEGGFSVLTIREGKTANARRTLVIHPRLVELGFLDMVRARQKAKAVQLWEGESADSRGRWGRRLSMGFHVKLVECGVKTPKLTFHSLRHDFEDALRRADLHGKPLGAYLAGRSQAGKVEASYGRGYTVEAKAAAIALVQFPALLLPHPADT